MPKYTKRPFQVGEYFLGQRPGSPAWLRCRYNPQTRQTERVSLGTSDYEVAKRLLTQWFVGHGQGPMGQEVMLSEVLLGNYEAHGKNIASAKDVPISNRYWLEHFGNIPAKQASGQEAINGLKGYLARKGFSDNYINRVLSVGRAALMRAYERGLFERPADRQGRARSLGAGEGAPPRAVGD